MPPHVMRAGLENDDSLIAAPAAEGLCRFWPDSAEALVARAGKIDAVRKVLAYRLIHDKNELIGPATAGDVASGERLMNGEASKEILAKLGTLVANDLVSALESTDSRISEPARQCAQRLVATPLAPAVAEALRTAINVNDEHLRHRVTELIVAVGKLGVPALIEGTRSKDPEVLMAAVEALARRDPESADGPEGAYDRWPRRFPENTWPVTRGTALTWATKISIPPEGLVDRLVEVISQPASKLGWYADQRILAIQALGHFAADPKVVVPVLQGSLNDEDNNIRFAAIEALQTYGAEAKPAIDNLAVLTTSEDPKIRTAAAKTLLNLGSEGRHAIAPFYLKEFDRRMKTHRDLIDVVRQIAELGPEAQPAVDNLVRLLSNDDNNLRIEVVCVLGQLGPGGKPAIPALTRMVDNKNGEIRAAAVDAAHAVTPDGINLGPAAAMAAVYQQRPPPGVDRFAAVLRNTGVAATLTRRLTDIGSDDPR